MSKISNTIFKHLNSKAEKQMIKRSFWDLHNKGILEIINYGEEKYKRKKDGKEIEFDRKINTTEYGFTKSIKINEKRNYSKSELEKISFIITTMLNKKSTVYANNLMNEIISEKFGSNKEFITDIVSKSVIKMTNYEKNDTDCYSLDLLLFLIKTKHKLNISISTETSTYNLNNVKLKSIVFRKKTFDLEFKDCVVTLTDIREIKSIESFNDDDFKNSIEKLESILSEFPIELTQDITELINGLKNIENIFEF